MWVPDIHHRGGHHRIDNVLLHRGAKLFGGYRIGVLRGNDDRLQALRLAVHVFHAHLGLAIGPQKIDHARAPRLAQPAHQFVGQHDGQRHELGSFVAGVAEHQALIARAASVDAHGDVRRLALNHVQDAAGFRIVSERGVVVADVLNHLARQFRNVHVRRGGDLPGDHANAGGNEHLAGNAAGWVVRENRVEDGVGDLIRHLIGMAFGDGLGRENVSLHACLVRWKKSF